MKMSDSKAQIEVWEWKNQAYNEVKHLPIEKAIEKRLKDSNNTLKSLGLMATEKLCLKVTKVED